MNSDIYNYESPITRIQNQLLEEMVRKEEDQFVCEVRQTIGYQIDKAELIKALNYDRDQYEKGYQDGYSAGYQKAESEKRKGCWLINSDGYYPYCSICYNEPEKGKMTDYCPKCGAYMKGESNDKTTPWDRESDPAITHWMPLPEPPKEDEKQCPIKSDFAQFAAQK